MFEDPEVLRQIREATAKQRGYADMFGWPDRDVEEWGVADAFLRAAVGEPGFPYSDLKSRGRGMDPPDCEARAASGARLAIEVTEVVDGAAIVATKARGALQPAAWDGPKLISFVADVLRRKDIRHRLKDSPYDDYIVLLYTDEPLLTLDEARTWLAGHRFQAPKGIDRAYLIVAYDIRPESERIIRLDW